jgi:hypothetical protein
MSKLKLESRDTSSYEKCHWSLKISSIVDPFHIGVYEYEKQTVGVYTNPSDCRGYRLIVRRVALDDMYNGLNRPTTFHELAANNYICSMVASCIEENTGLFVQIMRLGNNSHTLMNGHTVLGSEMEPFFEHCHLICRGKVGEKYICNLPLCGPEFGDPFNMKTGKNEKISWLKEDLVTFSVEIRGWIRKFIDKRGLSVKELLDEEI